MSECVLSVILVIGEIKGFWAISDAHCFFCAFNRKNPIFDHLQEKTINYRIRILWLSAVVHLVYHK